MPSAKWQNFRVLNAWATSLPYFLKQLAADIFTSGDGA